MIALLKVGFGYTRLCNMRCIFCYSARVKPVSWSPGDAERLITDIYEHHGVFDLNWGTGENILAPGFAEVVRFAHRLGVKQNITTNGSIIYRPEVLDYIEEVDVSIDHPAAEVHNRLRGHPRAYQLAVEAARLAAGRDATVTVTTVLLRYNASYEVARGLVELARSLGARYLRFNLYFYRGGGEAVHAPSVEAVAEFLRGLADAGARLVGTSDPAVAALLGVEPVGYLGSVRILPDGTISPSTYLTWGEWTVPVDQLYPDVVTRFYETSVYRRFEGLYRRVFPEEAPDRVAALGRDPYKPPEGLRGSVSLRPAAAREELIHLGYLPTTILEV